jgi:hypothetical protein
MHVFCEQKLMAGQLRRIEFTDISTGNCPELEALPMDHPVDGPHADKMLYENN